MQTSNICIKFKK